MTNANLFRYYQQRCMGVIEVNNSLEACISTWCQGLGVTVTLNLSFSTLATPAPAAGHASSAPLMVYSTLL